MIDKLKNKLETEIEKLDVNDIKAGAKTLAKETAEIGVDVVKGGVMSVINGIMIKALFFLVFAVLIVGGGCVGTKMLMEQDHTEKRIVE